MVTEQHVRNFMRNELYDLDSEVWEQGEVNYTRLAEEAAHYFDYDEWLDDETHWVWDLALKEGERAEKARRSK